VCLIPSGILGILFSGRRNGPLHNERHSETCSVSIQHGVRRELFYFELAPTKVPCSLLWPPPNDGILWRQTCNLG
jgi:hypothetical protein